MTHGAKRMLRLEAIVASPPTSKCEEIIRILERIAAEKPDLIRVDIYYAGSSSSVAPTRGFMYDPQGKRREIPSVYVNGICETSGCMPEEATIRKAVERELAKGEVAWQ